MYKYDDKKYQEMWKAQWRIEVAYNSAMEILPIIFEYYKPSNIIDIGCGVGAWLKAFKDLGIKNYKGIDGVDIEEPLVPKENIETTNLLEHKNINNIKYDLVTSLEVAEHIPNQYSKSFIDLLTSYGDVILFSAAIPHQPGVDHINCRPILFWVDIFNKKGYDCFDFIRNKTYYNKKVTHYYSQNILLFVKKEKTDIFTKQHLEINNFPIFFYHPIYFESLIKEKNKLITEMNNLKSESESMIKQKNNLILEVDRLNSKINKIAWWIPIKKLRDKFRS